MDERLRILKMVEDGTITAEQAAELMKACLLYTSFCRRRKRSRL